MIPTKEEMYRALVERHGAALQARLADAAVAVCGLGGLGSNIAIHLARTGVGRLLLIDFDTVDLSNLNRQQYFPDQLGEYKTDALLHTLGRIAPYCKIDTQTVKLDVENIPVILADYPIICEAFDKADQKAMLVNAVLTYFPHAYLVAASGMAGFDSANSIITRKVTHHFYLCGDGKSDVADGMGLVASRVAVCAAHQANAVLRIIAGKLDA